MIILITGASLTGKTLLAQRMLEEYKMPYVSIDHLKMGLIRSGKTDLTPEDDEALMLSSLAIGIWAVVFLIINMFYFPLSEEPGLRKRFGKDYDEYCKNVPRYIPRLTPWKANQE
jgi:protein-S-isoprenylcysteine O-methyltransferase Ste14